MDAAVGYLYNSNMTNDSTSVIFNYNLFGEVGDLPDVVHCETIEARSQLHNWEFVPHRHANLHQVLHLAEGSGSVTLDGDICEIPPATVVNVPIGVVHGYTFAPGTTGHVVTIASEILDIMLQPSEGLQQVLSRPDVFPARESVRQTIDQIAQSFARRDFARAHILRSLCGLLFGQIAQDLLGEGEVTEQPDKPELLTQFEALLDLRFREQWTVNEYAKALAKTPTHLSRVTRAATGRPATALIEERVIREARRNLVYTNLPVSTIAYELGYNDPAYFSRVFSKAIGMSPRKFRAHATSIST